MAAVNEIIFRPFDEQGDISFPGRIKFRVIEEIQLEVAGAEVAFVSIAADIVIGVSVGPVTGFQGILKDKIPDFITGTTISLNIPQPGISKGSEKGVTSDPVGAVFRHDFTGVHDDEIRPWRPGEGACPYLSGESVGDVEGCEFVFFISSKKPEPVIKSGILSFSIP